MSSGGPSVQAQLYAAARKGDLSAMEALLESGADINGECELGSSPLVGAAMGGYRDGMEFLLDRGADPDVEFDDAELTKVLGAFGRKVLHQVVIDELLDRLRLLLLHGATVDILDDERRTPLYVAARHGNPEIVDVLLSAGADPNAADLQGRTPLYAVVRARNYPGTGELRKVAELLLAAGANVDLARNSDRRTPLAESAARGDLELVRLFLRHGANPLAGDVAQMLPLHWAAVENRADCASALLRANTPVDARDCYGSTPLLRTRLYGSTETMQVLIDAGADVNAADEDGTTLLMLAAATDAQRTAFLLESGADVLTVDHSGDSALHFAARHGSAEAVELLLRAGADRLRRNADGLTPADCARERGNVPALSRLAVPISAPTTG